MQPFLPIMPSIRSRGSFEKSWSRKLFYVPRGDRSPSNDASSYGSMEKAMEPRGKVEKAISDAFKVYKEMYAEQSAEEVVQLARQHPDTSDELPRNDPANGHNGFIPVENTAAQAREGKDHYRRVP